MVVVMIVAIRKIHPFLSIMGVSLILALLALPLAGAGHHRRRLLGHVLLAGHRRILGAMVPYPAAAAASFKAWRPGDSCPSMMTVIWRQQIW